MLQHVLLEYRNAHYSGMLDERMNRQEIGLLITDDCQVVLAEWRDGLIHGKYFYSDGRKYAYGTMAQGKYEGFNVFTDPPWTMYSECQHGKLDGRVTMVKEGGRTETFMFRAGEKLDTEVSDQEPTKLDEENSQQSVIDALIHRSDQFRSDRQGIGKVYHGMTNSVGNPHGLGFIIRNGKLHSAGIYADGKQNGPGRCYHPGQIHDGTFKDDELQGVGCKWISSTGEYMFAQFRPNRYTVLSKGHGAFPSKPARRIREQFHLRSSNYHNDWVLIRKLINVQVKPIIRTSSHSNLLIQTPGSALAETQTVNKELVRMLEAVFFLQSPRTRSPSDERAKQTYETSPTPTTKSSNKFLTADKQRQILRNSTNEVQELKNDSMRLYGKLQNNPNDSLLEAIRQYQRLSAMKKQKRKARTPKKRRHC